MKRLLLALIMLPALSALASPIPSYVEKTLKTFQYDNYVLRNGILVLSITKPEVNNETAFRFFSSICDTIFLHPWDEKTITSMRIWNSRQDQGFEFKGGGKECKQVGQLNSDETKAFIEARIIKL